MSCGRCEPKTVEYVAFDGLAIPGGTSISSAFDSAGYDTLDMQFDFAINFLVTQLTFNLQQSWDGGTTWNYVMNAQQSGGTQQMTQIAIVKANFFFPVASGIHVGIPISGDLIRVNVFPTGTILPGDTLTSVKIRLSTSEPVPLNIGA